MQPRLHYAVSLKATRLVEARRETCLINPIQPGMGCDHPKTFVDEVNIDSAPALCGQNQSSLVNYCRLFFVVYMFPTTHILDIP